MDSDERTSQMVRELAVEKAAQLEGAKAVLLPLTFIVAVIVFALCFWRYNIGVVLSVGAAILTIPAILLGVALPVGYLLGNRAPAVEERTRNRKSVRFHQRKRLTVHDRWLSENAGETR